MCLNFFLCSYTAPFLFSSVMSNIHIRSQTCLHVLYSIAFQVACLRIQLNSTQIEVPMKVFKQALNCNLCAENQNDSQSQTGNHEIHVLINGLCSLLTLDLDSP